MKPRPLRFGARTFLSALTLSNAPRRARLSALPRTGGSPNWQASAAPQIGLATPIVAGSATDPRTKATQGETEGDWLCAWCHNRVANEKDRFTYNGKDEFTFSNPERIKFGIITFSRTFGCREAGTPTVEHTWFAGYAWSFCQCDRCGQQLGWYYTGLHQFAGLIKDRIVRALQVNN